MAALAQPALLVRLVAKGPSASLGRLKARVVAGRLLVVDIRRAATQVAGRPTVVSVLSPFRRRPLCAVTALRPELIPVGLEITSLLLAPHRRRQVVLPQQGLARHERPSAKWRPIRVQRRDDAHTPHVQATRVGAGKADDVGMAPRKAPLHSQRRVAHSPRPSGSCLAPSRPLLTAGLQADGEVRVVATATGSSSGPRTQRVRPRELPP